MRMSTLPAVAFFASALICSVTEDVVAERPPFLHARPECQLSSSSVRAITAFANAAAQRAVPLVGNPANLRTSDFDWFAIFEADRSGSVIDFATYFQGYDANTGRHMGTFDVDTSEFHAALPKLRFLRPSRACDYTKLWFHVRCERSAHNSCGQAFGMTYDK